MITRHAVFFILMTVASAITVLKLAIIAAVFTAENFTLYASAFAAAVFFSSLLSFGLVEGTPKKYTRWIARGRFDAIVLDVDLTFRKLAVRVVLFSIIGACLLARYSDGGAGNIMTVVSVLVIAFSVKAYSVAASILRGLDRLFSLAYTAIARVLVATVAATAVGYFAGWETGLLAEGATSILLAGALILFLRKELTAQEAADLSFRSDDPPEMTDAGGRWLFGAYLLASIPMSLDRMAVTHFDSATVAAQYAFVAIWILGAFTASSIYVQKFGPDMIRRREAEPDARFFKLSAAHAFGLAIFLAAGSAGSFLVLYYFFPEMFWNKYALSLNISILVTVCAFSQAVSLFEWVMVALDRERMVFLSSFVFVSLVAAGFLITILFSFGAIGYLSGMIVGRMGQGLVHGITILKADRSAGRVAAVNSHS